MDICCFTSDGKRFNRLACSLGPCEVYKMWLQSEQTGTHPGLLSVIDGLLDLSMQHVVAGQD